MIQETTLTQVEPQDLVMNQFRLLFSLVTTQCKVSKDGNVMVYAMSSLASAARWLSDAEQIITVNRLPLNASVKAYQKKGEEKPHRVELRIVYKP